MEALGYLSVNMHLFRGENYVPALRAVPYTTTSYPNTEHLGPRAGSSLQDQSSLKPLKSGSILWPPSHTMRTSRTGGPERLQDELGPWSCTEGT